MDCIVHGILQARILEWVAFPFFRGSSEPRDWTQVSRIAGGFFTKWATRETQEYWSGQLFSSPEDLPDPGIEWGSLALQADSLPTELSGKPREKQGNWEEERLKVHQWVVSDLCTKKEETFLQFPKSVQYRGSQCLVPGPEKKQHHQNLLEMQAAGSTPGLANYTLWGWSPAICFIKPSKVTSFPVAQMAKHLPAMWETRVQCLGREDPLEKEMATHCSILAWIIPWMEEPGKLQSMGLQRVGHD